MNLNIANELKTGPRTEEGKAITRLNALKTGRYSKLLNELNCNVCKRKSYCTYFKENSNCSLRGEIAQNILIDNLDSVSELAELYKLSITKGVEGMIFETNDSVKWFNLAVKQLELIDKMMNRPEKYDV